jgi:hypothetical protein
MTEKKKEKSSLKKKAFEAWLVGGGAASGAATGIPLGLETAAANMGTILTAEQMSNPALVELATNIIVGSSVSGGVVSGLMSGLALLALYKSGKIHLPPHKLAALKRTIRKLEKEAKKDEHKIEHFIGKEYHKLRDVV